MIFLLGGVGLATKTDFGLERIADEGGFELDMSIVLSVGGI